MKTFKEELSELAREGFLTFEKNKPLSSCSSFRIGGEADFALYPRNPEGFCRHTPFLCSMKRICG